MPPWLLWIVLGGAVLSGVSCVAAIVGIIQSLRRPSASSTIRLVPSERVEALRTLQIRTTLFL